jgi:ribosomal protein S18 acetylase RimI-like enzyme
MKLQTDIKLRNWQKGDFPVVKDILITTWKDAYSFIPLDDIETYFKEFYSDQRLIEMLDDPFTKGILADVEMNPVGWMKLYHNNLEKKFFVSSLYVLPGYQGYGIGHKLLEEAYKIARGKNFNKVWLGVMKQNIKSLEWYTKLGFVFVEEEPFQMGSTEVMHLIGYKVI